MKKALTLLYVFLVSTNFIIAQTAHIKGTILDADNKDAIGGVIVRCEKTKVVSDESGKYDLSVPAGTHELIMSTDGYKSDRRPLVVTSDTVIIIDVLLKPSVLQLHQVEAVSQYRKNASKETISTQVITADQIQNTNSTDLGDVVAKSPGVLVQDGQISIRGGSPYSYGVGSRTEVMQDGIPLMSADLGQAQVQMANLSDVKQVEIIEGASSVVYGSGALDGVVNLVTNWPTDPEPANEISISSGVYDKPKAVPQQWWTYPPIFNNINFHHSEQIKNIQFVIAGNMYTSTGYISNSGDTRVQGFWKLRYLSPKIPGLNFGVNGSIQYERDQTVFVTKNIDSSAFIYNDGSNDKYLRTNLDPFFNYQNSKGHHIVINTRYMDIFRNGGSKAANAVSNQYTVFDQYQYRYKNFLVISAGVPFNVGSSRSNLYSGQDFTFNAAVYTQVEFDYKILSLQGGVRYEAAGVDTVVVKNQPPIFRIGANVQAGKASFLRASWGQGFRIPSIGEKYIAQQFTGSLFIIPNDTLHTETSWNMEIGFRQMFKIKSWVGYFDACVFWEEQKNYIQYNVNLWPNKYSNGSQIFPDSDEYGYPGHNYGDVLGLKPSNVLSTRVAGYEISIAGAGKMGPLEVKTLMGYTYTYPGQEATAQAYPIGQFLKDVFIYNFKRVPTDYASTHLEQAAIRQLVRGDIEFGLWKVYWGATVSYASTPEAIPPLFAAASSVLFTSTTGNTGSQSTTYYTSNTPGGTPVTVVTNPGKSPTLPNELINYYSAHLHGDVVIDIRVGMKLTDKMKLGFIIKNVGNVFYELRPGLPEPNRNYTLQFTYSFGRTATKKS